MTLNRKGLIKVLITARNRFAITKKAIQSLHKFTNRSLEIYVHDNQSNDDIPKRFEYFGNLIKDGLIKEYTFRRDEACANYFSKGLSLYLFGIHTRLNLPKDYYDFILLMDNDFIICKQGWDDIIFNTWSIAKIKHKNIKVITQCPGGMVDRKKFKIGNIDGEIGKAGGSGFWTFQQNFFEDVGLIDINKLKNRNNADDQVYWGMIGNSSFRSSGIRDQYIFGINDKFTLHCGRFVGSVINLLRVNQSINTKEFEDTENRINNLTLENTIELAYKENCHVW